MLPIKAGGATPSPGPERAVGGQPHASPDGSVWVGAGGGVSRFDGDTWTRYTTADGLPAGAVLALAVSGEGVLWLSAENSGVARFDGQQWTIYDAAGGLVSNAVGPIGVDSAGTVWVGTAQGIARCELNAP